jgi:hypothetical protein
MATYTYQLVPERTTCVLHHGLRPHYDSPLVGGSENYPLSVSLLTMTDLSTHLLTIYMFPLCLGSSDKPAISFYVIQLLPPQMATMILSPSQSRPLSAHCSNAITAAASDTSGKEVGN